MAFLIKIADSAILYKSGKENGKNAEKSAKIIKIAETAILPVDRLYTGNFK